MKKILNTVTVAFATIASVCFFTLASCSKVDEQTAAEADGLAPKTQLLKPTNT